MFSVYLAGPYGARDKIRGFAYDLARNGINVSSSWLDETHEINAGTQGAATSLPDDVVSGHAQTDLDDIVHSDVLVLFTAGYAGCEGGGGRHVETGYALALDTPVFVVGNPEHVFHRLGDPVTVFETWHDALGALLDATRGDS